MVQITFDTQHDTLEDLEQALRVLQDAIARRKGTPSISSTSAPIAPAAPVLPAEDTIETPFMKISFSSEDGPAQQPSPPTQAPTLNQLLQDASLTDAEMSQMFKQVEATDAPAIKPKKKETSEAAFIEIVEFEEEAEKR